MKIKTTLRNSLYLICILALFNSCGPKRLPRNEPPIEPGTTPTEKAPPEKKPGENPPQPPPGESTKPALEAPVSKPRPPARGDSASSRLVDSGVKQMNAGNLDDAEQLFEQALRVSPSNGKPYYYLGVLAAKQKNYERSLNFLEQAENYLHDNDFWMSQILMQEGVVLKALNQKSAAKEKLEEALRRDPTNQHAAQELKTLEP